MSSDSVLQIHKPIFKGRNLTCTYSFKNEVFKNSFTFPEDAPGPISEDAERLLNWISVVSAFGLFSVEYFDYLKTDFILSQQETEFFEKLMYFGLGEFRYTNNLPINKMTLILGEHPTVSGANPASDLELTERPLLLNGGGKDGSVSAFLLNAAGVDFTWFQRGDTVSQSNVYKNWQSPAFIVKRRLDSNRKDRKYSGHRPISAGIAFLAVLSAILYGFDAVIASNELSANEGNFTLDGFNINHQYSKSIEFEKDIQALLSLFRINVQYFSLLRPLHELQIALIASQLNDKQLAAITSCNNGTKTGKWCMSCSKCAFVVLIMTAASPSSAEKIWGYQAINSPSLLAYFDMLLNPEVEKPFECVGTLDECQLAAYIIRQNKDLVLELPVCKLFDRFASDNNLSILYELGDSSIPNRYQDALHQMRVHLEEWRATKPELER